MTAPWGPGFHGKLPSRGDFVGAGLPRAFTDPWDDWLSAALDGARRRLGAAWEPSFAAAPPWRLVLAHGVCGADAVAGVMVPSADRVGRPYPFLIAAALPGAADPAACPAAAAAWFDGAERAARALTAETAAPAAAAARVAALGRPAAGGVFHRALIEDRLGPLHDGMALWWTRGGGLITASVLACDGLPDPGRFTALLDGAWAGHGWDDLDAAGPEATLDLDALPTG